MNIKSTALTQALGTLYKDVNNNGVVDKGDKIYNKTLSGGSAAEIAGTMSTLPVIGESVRFVDVSTQVDAVVYKEGRDVTILVEGRDKPIRFSSLAGSMSMPSVGPKAYKDISNLLSVTPMQPESVMEQAGDDFVFEIYYPDCKSVSDEKQKADCSNLDAQIKALRQSRDADLKASQGYNVLIESAQTSLLQGYEDGTNEAIINGVITLIKSVASLESYDRTIEDKTKQIDALIARRQELLRMPQPEIKLETTPEEKTFNPGKIEY